MKLFEVLSSKVLHALQYNCERAFKASAKNKGLTIIFDASRKPVSATRKYNSRNAIFGDEQKNDKIGFELAKAGKPEAVFSFVNDVIEALIQKGPKEFTPAADGGSPLKLHVSMLGSQQDRNISINGVEQNREFY